MAASLLDRLSHSARLISFSLISIAFIFNYVYVCGYVHMSAVACGSQRDRFLERELYVVASCLM